MGWTSFVPAKVPPSESSRESEKKSVYTKNTTYYSTKTCRGPTVHAPASIALESNFTQTKLLTSTLGLTLYLILNGKAKLKTQMQPWPWSEQRSPGYDCVRTSFWYEQSQIQRHTHKPKKNTIPFYSILTVTIFSP